MKQTFGKFELEAECVFAKPEQKDFDNGLNSLGIQYGADFTLRYKDRKQRKNALGMLQFIKAATKVGNSPTSSCSGIALDSNIKQGIRPVTDYLFGTVGLPISYSGSIFCGRLTCQRNTNECEICDCPREIMKYDQDKSLHLPAAAQFWNFVVEIQENFGIIFPIGVSWSYEIKQIGKTNQYTAEISILEEASLDSIDYNNIFSGYIADNSYKILR